MVDAIITEINAFAEAEKLARALDATAEQLDAAAAVLAQSPDWKQRILARELRAGMYALPGAELLSEDAFSGVREMLDTYPEFHTDEDGSRSPGVILYLATSISLLALVLMVAWVMQ